MAIYKVSKSKRQVLYSVDVFMHTIPMEQQEYIYTCTECPTPPSCIFKDYRLPYIQLFLERNFFSPLISSLEFIFLKIPQGNEN